MKTIEQQEPTTINVTPGVQAQERKTLPRQVKIGARTLLANSDQAYRHITVGARLLPDFVIIGGQRCGTSSLYYNLLQHVQIASAATKEVHFFDDFYAKGVDWYRAQFPTVAYKYYIEHVRKLTFITGEASPYYLFHPQVPKRVADLLPNVKLIALLRNPIDRAYSQHWLEVKGKYETLSFAEAIKAEPARTSGERERLLQDGNYASFAHRRYTYLARGIYVDQLQYWMQFVPREQFLILRSEDLYRDTPAVMRQTLEFLGLRDNEARAHKNYQQYKVPSKTGYRNKDSAPKMDPVLRTELVEYFRPHNQRLKEFLGRDFGWDK